MASPDSDNGHGNLSDLGLATLVKRTGAARSGVARAGVTRAGVARVTALITALALVVSLVASMTGAAPAAAASSAGGPPPAFPDIGGHWARFEIELLASRGVVEALDGDRFAPEVPVNRADLAKMLVIGLGHESEVSALAEEPSTFADVSSDHPDRAYIEVAYELGIVNGYPDLTFRPEAAISRAELTAMVIRALGWEKLARSATADKAVYPDQSSIGDWALGYALLARRTGIIKGYPDGTFRPLAETTRSQAAVLVARMLSSMGRLYDLSGVVQSVELVDGAVNLQTLTGDRRLLVRRDTRIYRNGQPVSLADLGFFDEAMVALDAAGRPAFIAAYLASVSGTLTGVAPDGGSVTLDGRTFAVTPDAAVYRNGRPVPRSNLRPGDLVTAVLKVIDGSNAVRALDAVNVVARGVMVGYDVARRELVVDVSSGGASNGPAIERRAYGVLPTAIVFLDGRRAGPTDLKPGDRLELAADQPVDQSAGGTGVPLSFISAERPR